MNSESTQKKAPAEDHAGTVRQRIVKAAAQLFISEGYEGASTADIARLASTSKREIYKYFPSKEDIFQDTMEYLCALETETPAAQTDDHELLEDVLWHTADAVLARFTHSTTRGVFIAAVAAIPRFPGIIETFWRMGPGAAVDVIAEALVKEQAAGRISVSEPFIMAHGFMMDCVGPIVTEQLFDQSREFDKAERHAHIDKVVNRFLSDLR
ncbi:MAG: TetR/AcrR family transcriptional regulator [Pseudomonadota bacterium]